MTVRLVHRPARITTPTERPDTVHLAPPPQMPEGPGGGLPLQTMLPVIGAISSVTMILVLRSNPVMVVVGALILVVALVGGVGTALSQRGAAARNRRTQRERYLDYLERVRDELRSAGRDARTAAELLDPDPFVLPDLLRDPARRFERRRSNSDFLRVRMGTGDVPWFDLELPTDSNPVQPFDPLMMSELGQVAAHYSRVHGMPVTVDLDGAAHVAVIGERDDVLTAARALLVQAASLHSPDDLRIAAAFPPSAAADWACLDLLPHASMDAVFDGPLHARRVAETAGALSRVLAAELGERASVAAAAKRGSGTSVRRSTPALLVFVDDFGSVASALPIPDADLSLNELRVTVVHLLSDRLHEPSDVTVRVTVSGRRADVADARRAGPDAHRAATVDAVSPALVEAVARSVAPLRLTASTEDRGETADAVGITDLLGIDDVMALDTRITWRPRSARDFLRVPIGVDDFGAPLLLDLKESAQLGMGPHGICIGATGSGKSEMLRTLILGLAISHPPEDLRMVLVDYKGGSAFAPFAGLPHVAGLIDNLADDPQLTQRARASITGEVVRRQQVLKDAGSPSITHYRELRETRPGLPALPHLVLVIDEFGELLAAEPDFVDLLLTIGRIGRSIGVHLLLSSQRIEGGKLRGLDTYLSYRLGLRTFSEAESQVVLDTPDAFHLPAIPGFGYLKVDTSIYSRFRAGFVSGPVRPRGAALPPDSSREPLALPTYNTVAGPATSPDEPRLTTPSVGRALIDEAVDRVRTVERNSTPVWLPTLPRRLALSRALGRGADDSGEARRPLSIPLGLLDDPAHQRQDPWLLDLTRGGGHAAIIGAPQSGRTTFLRTMAASIALTHTPRQVTMYGMDLSGGGLGRIDGFPHVGGVATRSSRDRLRRLLEELHGMIRTREAVFRDRNIDSLPILRARHAAGELPELVSADIVLLVDGLGALRTDFEELEEPLAELLTRGGSFGVHVVLAMTRWNELRMTLQPLIGQRIELRLNDPQDSVIGRKLAATLRADEPGRVLTEDGLLAQVALPVLDDTDDGDVGNALEALAARSASGWEGPSAAPIRLLPEFFDPAELPDEFDEPELVPFGLRQDTMEPAYFDLVRDQHLLVFGDTASGKTSLLRGLVRGFVDRYTADELVLAVMDTRGGAAADVPDDYLGGHATNGVDARGLATSIAQELASRASANARGDAPGPRIVVVVDDYDILSSGGTEPLSPLLPYLPAARDLRLHVLLTRPVAGASRALYDMALQAVRDTGGAGFVMSGERSEGQIYPKLYAEQMVAGRGRFVRRAQRPMLVQVAHYDPAPDPQATENRRSDAHAP